MSFNFEDYIKERPPKDSDFHFDNRKSELSEDKNPYYNLEVFQHLSGLIPFTNAIKNINEYFINDFDKL